MSQVVTQEPPGRTGSDTDGAVVESRWPTGGSSRAAAWLSGLLSVLAVGGLYTLLYLRNDRYFFIDDAITGEMPNRIAIGRLLRAGEWPWLNTEFVNGGAHAIEYSHGVFNPVNLAFAVLLADLDDIAFGGYLLILFHALVLTAATAWLGRLLGLSAPWTAALAVSVGFQPASVVWNAPAWYEGLMSFTWLVLAVAAAFAFHLRGKRRYGWLLLLSTYLVCTAGWPLAIPVLGLFVAALLAARLMARAALRQTVWLAVWAGAGLVCAMPALYPLLTSDVISARDGEVTNATNFNVVPLEGLLQFANGGYYGFFNNFEGYALQELPHFYVAWFILPVLVFWRSSHVAPHLRVPIHTTAFMSLLSGLAALGPERLQVFRFPVRFLQYWGFFLVLLAVLLVAHGTFSFTRRRLGVVLALVALLTLTAWQADPSGSARVLWHGAALAALCGGLGACLLVGSSRRGTPTRGTAVLRDGIVVLGTAGVLLALALTHEEGRGLDWRFPHDLSASESLSAQDYTLYYGGPLPAEAYDEFRFSMIGVMVGDRQVNGYTSLGYRQLRDIFPMTDRGDFEPGQGQAEAFSRVDRETGLQLLELMRVDQVITTKGVMRDEAEDALGDGWEVSDTGEFTVTFEREEPYELPGLVSYADPGLELAEPGGDCPQRASRECVAIVSAADEPARVVFARAWFPGYRATLDGEPLEIQRHRELFVAVDVPADRRGDLVLTYRSPGSLELGLLSLAVLVLLAVSSYLFGRAPSVAPAVRPDDAASRKSS